jgi:putative heme-binding domain-containing protein
MNPAVRLFAAEPDSTRPLRALLIAGGCCHDYANQQAAIAAGIQARANVRVDVYWTDNSTTAPVLPLYTKLNWAENYDVIIHDECAADIKDEALVNRIVAVHQKIPAVHLHCAMHSFRTGTDAWFAHLGLQSSGHGPQEPIKIEFVDQEHPITKPLNGWTTIREELYNNVKVFGAHALAVGKQPIGGDNPRVDQAIVVWTNESQGAKSFSTTIGHNTETVQDPRYLDLITRGLLWSCDKLNDDYLTPYQGTNETTFIDKEKHQAPAATDLGKIPDNATLVKVTASSTQNGHPAYHAIDRKNGTRFCADGPSYPQWLQFEFDQPQTIRDLELKWESSDTVYQYRVEGSVNGKDWTMLSDQSENTKANLGKETFTESVAVKFLRITGLKSSSGGWCSIWEVVLTGDGIGTLWPADEKSEPGKFVPLAAEPYGTRGNTIPRIETLTPEAEAEILKDVRVADGFTATVFAAPPAVNYPVFVAADVDGTLYVSSDGNGSLGRNPERGRVIRLRDLDGDGRADETKVFCQIDAPRGLVWDHDRLYLMHPPNLSVFFDRDGDGVAEEQKTLVKNLAFDYADRPADHTTNGMSLGPDGWLYIAGGDFGFLEAEGSDGTKLTHRGGGVIRVRTDGSDLQVYSTGTRNILEVAVSPEMEMFARDNTNDGGGWDVRLHHFTGGEDHGYPRLYKNFNDECVQPLADYGGGSGCGAVYIDEPGMGNWNNAPFTADWGTGSLYRHTVARSGATYQETAAPESFIKMTRPTDADVDGNSRVYCASWRGATFDWAGPNVGYIVCVRPTEFQPPPMPKWSTTSDEELIAQLDSPSYRRRIAAQRELIRRDKPEHQQLLDKAIARRPAARNLLLHLQTDASDTQCAAALSHSDPVVVHTAIRSLAARGAARSCFEVLDASSDSAAALRALAMMHSPQVVDGLIERLPTADDQLKRGIVAALCRLHSEEATWKGDSWGTRPDTRGPYYEPVPWSESDKIAGVLRTALRELDPNVAADLVRRHYYLGTSIFDPGSVIAVDTKPAKLAWSVEEEFQLKALIPKDAAKVSSLEVEDALTAAVQSQGNVELGRYLFTKANCVACHTVSQDEEQKGPYLGNIAQTYKRPDLAIAILDPSRTIAQGFATNTILTVDGDVLTGFVTDERSDRVTLRDQTGKQTTIAKDDIELRKTSEVSVMPKGVLNEYTTFELASLLDYLASLSK